MKKKTEKLEEVGLIGVDAGVCWVGDPCYILHAEKAPADIGKNWGEFCDKLEEKGRPAQFNYDMGHAGLGVVVSTGYGDGSYPVYVRRNSEGRIAEVRVVFIEEEE